jgi:hypothetical protein
MRSLMRYSCFLILLVCGLGIGNFKRLSAEELVLPQFVKDALGRYGELKTLSIKWVQEIQPQALAQTKIDKSKLESWSRPEACYMVWQGGKIFKQRYDGTRQWKDGSNTSRHEVAFDGRIFASGRPHLSFGKKKSETPIYSITLASDMEADAEYFGVECFEHLGLRLPHGVGELLKSTKLRSQIFFMLDQHGRLKMVGPVQVDGRSLMRVAIITENPDWPPLQQADPLTFERELRKFGRRSEEEIQQEVDRIKRAKKLTPRYLEHVFYLDPEFGYAVSRWEELTEDGRLRTQTNCSKHQKLPKTDIWLPCVCRTDKYTFDDKYPGEIFKTPFLTLVMEIADLDTKAAPDELFILKPVVPGTRVTDRSYPESKLGSLPVTYTVPSKPEDLDRVIMEARELTRVGAEREKRKNSIRIFLIAVSTVLLLIYLIIRYRRKGVNS